MGTGYSGTVVLLQQKMGTGEGSINRFEKLTQPGKTQKPKGKIKWEIARAREKPGLQTQPASALGCSCPRRRGETPAMPWVPADTGGLPGSRGSECPKPPHPVTSSASRPRGCPRLSGEQRCRPRPVPQTTHSWSSSTALHHAGVRPLP